MTRLSGPVSHRIAFVIGCVMLGALSGCATDRNGTALLQQQAQVQVELAKLRDKKAREEYSDQTVYLGLIRKMQQDGLYYASLAHIAVYLQRFAGNAEIQLMHADALRETDQGEAAAAIYRQVVATATGPQAAQAHHGLGLLAGRQDDFHGAVSELRAAQGLDPINPRIVSDLGYALMRAGALQEARVPVMQAMELDANSPRTVSNAAVWLLVDDKRAQANALMQKAALPEATRTAIRKEADRIARMARQAPAARPPLKPAALAASRQPAPAAGVLASPAPPAISSQGATP